MAGWDRKNGKILDENISDDKIWEKVAFLYSSSSMKTNTYKFGLLKSLLDNLFDGERSDKGIFYNYTDLFGKFTENYWNLVVKYKLKQMRPNGKAIYSSVEKIILNEIASDNYDVKAGLEFESLDSATKIRLVKKIKTACKGCVIGALYGDFDGTIYEFDLTNSDGLYLNLQYYYFFLKYKKVIETLNYFYWAKFLEKYNDEDNTSKILDKLELSTPKRQDLSAYLKILKNDLGIKKCFYCGKELKRAVEVDHFIPWSFVRNDKIWNFVLSCKKCNGKKSNFLVSKKYVDKLKQQNQLLYGLGNNSQVYQDLLKYNDKTIDNMMEYARISGFKEFDKGF